MRCKLGSWWVRSSSPLIQLYGCVCSINCTGCTVLYESTCLQEYANELGYKKTIIQACLCIFCNNPVTTGHHPPTPMHSTTSPVLDPARTKRLLTSQNQPPDSRSVHGSQRQQLWLSLHRSHRHTCFGRFCLECSTISRGDKRRNRYVSPPQDFRKGCHLKILGQDFAKRAHFRPSENLGKILRQHFYP